MARSDDSVSLSALARLGFAELSEAAANLAELAGLLGLERSTLLGEADGADPDSAVEGMLRLAEQCVAPARKDRPSMRRCTEALWTVRRDYHRRQEPRQDASPGIAAGERSAEWVSR
jgi:hypothetical protein